ncbi:hypothetical protein DB30_06926 [Enhygromyxa salina]|uniref:Uncharacterized protein n=1 Tax=Enhygromyxa salina TaxID=215803 RepID=A0A0C1Z9R8_9BACT|nr:hypothetical protein [Enhygromyxa salina]KIG14324.1 hypothetical protein DB30_06926 [Enhygromyxa salina]
MPLLLSCAKTVVGDDGSSNGEGDSDTSAEGVDSNTGDGDPPEDWCGLSEGPSEPWFQVYQGQELLGGGSDLRVECGFQGFFMLETDPQLGGFIPESEEVEFHVTLDVEGYNVGPNGHFAESDFNIYVACCEETYEYSYECYYLQTRFQLFPPDQIDDLSVIHGLPGTLSVTMQAPEGPVEQVLDVQMWAVEQNSEWEFCDY